MKANNATGSLCNVINVKSLIYSEGISAYQNIEYIKDKNGNNLFSKYSQAEALTFPVTVISKQTGVKNYRIYGTNIDDENNDSSPCSINITVEGKNKILEEWVVGTINPSTGNSQNDESYKRLSNNLPITQGNYTLSYTGTGTTMPRFFFYNQNGEFISYASARNGNTIKVPSDTVSFNMRIKESDEISDFQLEKGFTVTDYEIYCVPKTITICLENAMQSNEYIDYQSQKYYPYHTSVTMPELPLHIGTNIITIESDIAISKMLIKGKISIKEDIYPVINGLAGFFDYQQGVSGNTWNDTANRSSIQLFNSTIANDGSIELGNGNAYGIFSIPPNTSAYVAYIILACQKPDINIRHNMYLCGHTQASSQAGFGTWMTLSVDTYGNGGITLDMCGQGTEMLSNSALSDGYHLFVVGKLDGGIYLNVDGTKINTNYVYTYPLPSWYGIGGLLHYIYGTPEEIAYNWVRFKHFSYIARAQTEQEIQKNIEFLIEKYHI